MTELFKKHKFIISVLFCIVIIFIQIYVLNFDSTSGKEFEVIDKKLASVEIENGILAQKIASASSLLAITSNAKLLGFESKKMVVSLYHPQPLAQIGNTL